MAISARQASLTSSTEGRILECRRDFDRSQRSSTSLAQANASVVLSLWVALARGCPNGNAGHAGGGRSARHSVSLSNLASTGLPKLPAAVPEPDTPPPLPDPPVADCPANWPSCCCIVPPPDAAPPPAPPVADCPANWPSCCCIVPPPDAAPPAGVIVDSVDNTDGSALPGTIFCAALMTDNAPGDIGSFCWAIVSSSDSGQGSNAVCWNVMRPSSSMRAKSTAIV